MFGASVAYWEIIPGVEINTYIMTAWGVMAILAILSYAATRNLKMVPSGVQNLVETLIEALYNFIHGMMGDERTRRYFPFLCTFFLFILMSNYIGLLPGVGYWAPYIPPTATLSVTAGLAVIVFLSIHIFGIKENGLAYFKHFVQPMWFLLPLNIVEELIKPVSLSVRLFGNVFGHEIVVMALFSLVPLLVPVPIQLLGVLTGAIQAFVFTLLATIYITGATEKHH